MDTVKTGAVEAAKVKNDAVKTGAVKTDAVMADAAKFDAAETDAVETAIIVKAKKPSFDGGRPRVRTRRRRPIAPNAKETGQNARSAVKSRDDAAERVRFGQSSGHVVKSRGINGQGRFRKVGPGPKHHNGQS